MNTIQIDQIKIYPEQRELRPLHISYLAQKMQQQGYNPSYPVTLDIDNGLIDGGHRLAAAQQIGLTEIPCLHLNGDTRRIYHAIRCNEDGADTQKYDVFDYAELCHELNQSGWTGDQIARELGWGSDKQVIQYKNIRDKLHPLAWNLARGVTGNPTLVTNDESTLVTKEVTIVTWRESHFRSLLSHLPLNGQADHAIMRAQVQVIQQTLLRFNDPKNKVTAKWIEEVTERHAWHIQLAKYMRDNLVIDVPLSDRKRLLRNIKKNAFGDKPSEQNLDKFTGAISAVNERILGVRLYCDDSLQFIPTLPDKSISLVVADPPYNVTDHEWDKIGTSEEYLNWLNEWLDSLQPKLKEDYHLFIFCSPDYQADIEVLLRGKFPLKSRVIWEHRNLVSGREVTDKYICTWEMVFHCGTHSLNFPPEWDDTRFQVKQYARPQSNFNDKPYHPTPKPLDLIKLFIEHGSKPGDVILDPFAGGGTTGAAAVQVGQRRCILVEKSDKFCCAIEGRLGIKRSESE